MDDSTAKLTVYLTTKAHSALRDAAQATGDTKTDTVNRALNIYSLLVHAWKHGGGGALVFEVVPGEHVRVEIAPRT